MVKQVLGVLGSGLVFTCPGCKIEHFIPLDGRWEWNQSLENPNLSPSVKHTLNYPQFGDEDVICHYFIVNGNIQYCNDSHHNLKGQTIPLPEHIDD